MSTRRQPARKAPAKKTTTRAKATPATTTATPGPSEAAAKAGFWHGGTKKK